MATVKVHGVELVYTIAGDNVAVEILGKERYWLYTKIQKINGIPFEDKSNISLKKLREYLEKSKSIKRSLKTLEE